LKRTSVLRLGPEQLGAWRDAALTLAALEGLDAHAHAIEVRSE
jgi:histidinol dehydrogenase